MRRLDAAAAVALACMVATALSGEAVAYRFSAPIAIEHNAAFVQLPLPAGAYGRTVLPGLQDLRIVDARGERVPFALLTPRGAELQQVEQQRDATLYALPPRPAAANDWPSPVEIQVQGDRISVTRKGRPLSEAGAARSGGWLIDLGERGRDDLAPQSLHVLWSGPQEFTAAFGFETSDDLRTWRPGGRGQLMALLGASGALTQPTIVLPSNSGRFVRLVWADAATAPALTGARVIVAQQRSHALDAPTELVFAFSAATATAVPVWYFDLGGVLPLVQVDLRLPSGTRVVPARLQGRSRVDEAWRELGAAVFYRLERGAETSTSPPLALHASVRYLRVQPDARAAVLQPEQVQLVVQAQLASVVFATQGQAPFALQAGANNATVSALPVATLVPGLDEERKRFGRATLGPWTEIAAVAQAEEAQKKMATLRPLLLWAVLVIGVAVLGYMVWRLARERPAHD